MHKMKEYGITKFEIWVLKRIAKRISIQSHKHKSNITEYYRVINDAAEKEFTEDTKPSLDSFLQDCHADSLSTESEGKENA